MDPAILGWKGEVEVGHFSTEVYTKETITEMTMHGNTECPER